MPHDIRLFLVRHATSAANLDKSVNARLPDAKVPLAPHGHDQAVAAGKAIAPLLADQRVRMLVSPYLRTRQTADGVVEGMEKIIGKLTKFDRREELALREISFGLFDGIPDDELADHFPLEYAHYKKHVDFEGEFYAPMPMGESRVQVADRVKSVFGTILRDADYHRDDLIQDFIVVSHGVTLRAFIMQWMHYPVEWYDEQSNPLNASVTLITGGPTGYTVEPIFAGFEKTHTAQQEREEKGV